MSARFKPSWRNSVYLVYYMLFITKRVLFTLLRRTTIGVRAIVVNEQQQILLVKHVYQPGWFLPGGGLKWRETLTSAIIRELREEAGVEVLQEPKLFGAYAAINKGMADYPILFSVDHFKLVESHSYEIEEVGWFSVQALPGDISLATAKRIREFFLDLPKDSIW